MMQAGKCSCGCGHKFNDGDRIDLEHTIPLEAGGEDIETNWTLMLHACHKEKTKKDAGTIAKTKRQAGEKGQYARRKKRGHGTIKSRGFDKRIKVKFTKFNKEAE